MARRLLNVRCPPGVASELATAARQLADAVTADQLVPEGQLRRAARPAAAALAAPTQVTRVPRPGRVRHPPTHRVAATPFTHVGDGFGSRGRCIQSLTLTQAAAVGSARITQWHSATE